MRKINVVCVGKIKEDYLSDGIAEYVKRISRFARIEITELKDITGADEVKRESDLILEKLTGYKILLDINGKSLSSPEIAELMEKAYINNSEVTFIIGGSCGVDERVRAACDFRLSFGKATFPHQLMRLILCEQIYRALSITEKLPYHK